MKDADGNVRNVIGVLRASLVLILLFCASESFANDLSVDRHTLRAGETVTITVSLENEFATLDDLRVPVRNLTLSPAPSVMSEFSWINGNVVRRKVFRFAARAEAAGEAQVGPLAISLPDGQHVSFEAIVLQVVPNAAAESNEPVPLLRDLLASGRDPFFVVAEVDKRQAFLGEEIVVTWWLYNAATMQESQIGAVPKLSDFWVEEIDVRSAQPAEALVGDYVMQRIPVRRVALFPLRSGDVRIGSMELEAKIMRRSGSDRSNDREWGLIDTSFASAPLTINVRPLPAVAAGALVGELSMTCSPPRQKPGGPVIIDVALKGQGNVRGAAAPRLTQNPSADVQIIERGAAVDRASSPPSMTRRWQYVLFPKQPGMLTIPEFRLLTFSPSSASTRLLRCEAATLSVAAADPNEPMAVTLDNPSVAARVSRAGQWIVAASALILIVFFVSTLASRRRLRSQNVQRLIGDRTPAEIRDAVHAQLAADGFDVAILLRETSDRGDAYRALRSLLDALDQDRMTVDPSEIRRRVTDLLQSLQSAA